MNNRRPHLPRHGRLARLAACTLALAATATPALAAETVRVSVGVGGLQGNRGSGLPAIDHAGRTVAFVSAANLVTGDLGRIEDVFVHDRKRGEIALVSIGPDGSPADGLSLYPRLSRNGRLVAFLSRATNLVTGDANGVDDVFVRDRKSGVTERISVASDGMQGNAASSVVQISGDGRIVAFQSAASNLVAGDANGSDDVFAHDRKTGITARISVASDGGEANGPSSLSFFGGATGANGRLVAFTSDATNLVDGDANGFGDVFVRDRKTGATTRASVASDGSEANGTSAEAALSDNGRYVAFVSDATNLVAGDGNGQNDIFVHDLKRGRIERANVASDGSEANGPSRGASLSSDGRYVTFVSSASNLVADDTNGVDDVFVHDRKSGTTVRVSVDSSDAPGNGATSFGMISGNGKAVALQSLATNLVADDTNGAVDVFVRTLE